MTGAGGNNDMTSNLYATVSELHQEFGAKFIIGAVRSRDGISLAAVKNDHAGEPGLYAVITGDPGELREALQEDAVSPPGPEARPGGG